MGQREPARALREGIHRVGPAGAGRGDLRRGRGADRRSRTAGKGSCWTGFRARCRRPRRSTPCWPRAGCRWTRCFISTSRTRSPSSASPAGGRAASATRIITCGTCRRRRPGVCDRCGSALTQRPDDQPDTIRKRLQVYAQQTRALVEEYDRRGALAPDRLGRGAGKSDGLRVRRPGQGSGGEVFARDQPQVASRDRVHAAGGRDCGGSPRAVPDPGRAGRHDRGTRPEGGRADSRAERDSALQRIPRVSEEHLRFGQR